jgi:hypothetical protein
MRDERIRPADSLRSGNGILERGWRILTAQGHSGERLANSTATICGDDFLRHLGKVTRSQAERPKQLQDSRAS